jgi:hypothetical protein
MVCHYWASPHLYSTGSDECPDDFNINIVAIDSIMERGDPPVVNRIDIRPLPDKSFDSGKIAVGRCPYQWWHYAISLKLSVRPLLLKIPSAPDEHAEN